MCLSFLVLVDGALSYARVQSVEPRDRDVVPGILSVVFSIGMFVSMTGPVSERKYRWPPGHHIANSVCGRFVQTEVPQKSQNLLPKWAFWKMTDACSYISLQEK